MSHNPNSKYGFNANRQDRTGGGAHGLATGNGNAHMNSFLEANISDIEFDLEEDTEKDVNVKAAGAEPSFYSPESEFVLQNFSDDCVSIPEVPFVHWSIYRQSIQNVVLQQGHKFQRNQKQMNKFLCQMFKNVLNTAIDKKILRPWLLKYNLIMYQSGMQWKNNQIKQAVFFQTAQMISSRSSCFFSRAGIRLSGFILAHIALIGWSFGLGSIDNQGPSHEGLVVENLHGALGFIHTCHCDKAVTFRTMRVAVVDDIDVTN